MNKEAAMAANKRELKAYRLDAKKVQRVRKILKAKDETEAIERVLQLVIEDDKIERAHKRLVEGGGEFVDTLGRLPQ